MERYFNIAGPCVPGKHYMIPALERLPEVARLIDREQSFVIHAARQSGKTTALMALVRAINEKGEKRAVYFTLEAAQRFPDPNQGLPRIAAARVASLENHRVFADFAKRGLPARIHREASDCNACEDLPFRVGEGIGTSAGGSVRRS